MSRAGSNAAGAGFLPRMLRIQAAWRASTEWIERAAWITGSCFSRGPWPAYADTPRSSTAIAVFWNAPWLMTVAPKSNAVTTAIFEAIADVRAGRIGNVPPHLRDAHYSGAKSLGHGVGYVYAHDAPFGVAEQQYAPDVVLDRSYYRPTELGAESGVKQRWERVRRIIRGK